MYTFNRSSWLHWKVPRLIDFSWNAQSEQFDSIHFNPFRSNAKEKRNFYAWKKQSEYLYGAIGATSIERNTTTANSQNNHTLRAHHTMCMGKRMKLKKYETSENKQINPNTDRTQQISKKNIAKKGGEKRTWAKFALLVLKWCVFVCSIWCYSFDGNIWIFLLLNSLLPVLNALDAEHNVSQWMSVCFSMGLKSRNVLWVCVCVCCFVCLWMYFGSNSLAFHLKHLFGSSSLSLSCHKHEKQTHFQGIPNDERACVCVFTLSICIEGECWRMVNGKPFEIYKNH